MDSVKLRWTTLSLAVVLFGAVDLVMLLLMPAPQRTREAFIPPFLAGIVVIILIPSLVTFLERQQNRIERQRREIETLHAMDTAIAAEMDLSRLLEVAVNKAVIALDAEAGGIALFNEQSGKLDAEAYTGLDDLDERLQAQFRSLVRGGCGAGSIDPREETWEAACVPLAWGDGSDLPHPSGYLVAAKRLPTEPFSPADHALLSALAGTVVVAVSNARALEAAREAAHVRVELERERRVAQALTEGLLPDVPPSAGAWAFSRRYQAQSAEAQVGGDVYDVFPLREGDGSETPKRWGIVIADVSGKGLAAARQTAMVKYSLRSYAREHPSPARVLTRLNDALFDEPGVTGFVTLVYGVLDNETGTLTYASAGHEFPIVRRAADGSFETLAPTGMVLGAMPEMEYGEATVTLHPGDGVLLYTDGLTEARSPDGVFLETEGVERLLTDLRECPAPQLADTLMDAVRQYTAGRLSDDTALLWVERCRDSGSDACTVPA